jgi:hypothetical protein
LVDKFDLHRSFKRWLEESVLLLGEEHFEDLLKRLNPGPVLDNAEK